MPAHDLLVCLSTHLLLHPITDTMWLTLLFFPSLFVACPVLSPPKQQKTHGISTPTPCHVSSLPLLSCLSLLPMCGVSACPFSALVCDLLLRGGQGLCPNTRCQKSISFHNRHVHCLDHTEAVWCHYYSSGGAPFFGRGCPPPASSSDEVGYLQPKQESSHMRVPGLSLRDCVESPKNRSLRCSQLSAINRLAPFLSMPYVSIRQRLTLKLFLDFPAFRSKSSPQKIASTDSVVIWQTPGTLAAIGFATQESKEEAEQPGL